MAKLIKTSTVIKAAGQPPKQIEEFVGRINSQTEFISVARMLSPCGWSEPGQTPDFEEVTLVLKGILRVRTRTEMFEVKAGQAIIIQKGEWVQYGTPYPDGAEYIAICVPAFSPKLVNRDAS